MSGKGKLVCLAQICIHYTSVAASFDKTAEAIEIWGGGGLSECVIGSFWNSILKTFCTYWLFKVVFHSYKFRYIIRVYHNPLCTSFVASLKICNHKPLYVGCLMSNSPFRLHSAYPGNLPCLIRGHASYSFYPWFVLKQVTIREYMYFLSDPFLD